MVIKLRYQERMVSWRTGGVSTNIKFSLIPLESRLYEAMKHVCFVQPMYTQCLEA